MTPEERERLRRLDEMVLGGSPGELERVREADSASQLAGLSLCEVCLGPVRAPPGRRRRDGRHSSFK